MMQIKTITDLKEAKSLWHSLSPQKTIFDDWRFRSSFFKFFPLPILFLAAYDREELIGLLPLQKHPKHGYEFFDEYHCEYNHPFVKPGREEIIPELFAAIPGASKIYDLSGRDQFTSKLELEDYSYFLPLIGIESFEDFLKQRLSAKRRRSLAKEIAAVSEVEPEIEFVSARDEKAAPQLLEKLFSFNVSNFKDDSYLLEEEQAGWRELLKQDFDFRFAVIKIKGEIQAVSLSIVYNNDWHYLITGVNFASFPGLGKYLVKVNLEEAIKEKNNIFDAGLGDCGWKHLWHFDREPQYIFLKESTSD